MTPSTHLFDLIRSLDKHEKAFFRVWVSSDVSKPTAYLGLFDAISKMKIYDEHKLKRDHAHHPFIKRLPAVKNYLYHSILESLALFYSGKSLKTKVRMMITKAELLIKKGLTGQCPSILVKARSLAIQHDLFPQALEIITIERAVIKSTSQIQVFEKRSLELSQLEKEILAKQQNLSLYLEADSRIYNVRRKSTLPRTKGEMRFYHQLLKNDIFKNEARALSFESKVFYFRIKGLYFNLQNRFRESYNCRKKLVELYENRNVFFPETVLRYSSALYELAISQQYTKQYKEVEITVQKMKDLPNRFPGIKSERSESVIFKRALIVETDMYQRRGQFERGVSQVKAIENGLSRYGKRIDKDLLLIVEYNIACIYFGAGNYKKALLWINKILNDKDNEHAQDVICFARIINLLVHIEIGNRDLLVSITNSTFRFLTKRERLYRTETLILEFVKKIAQKGVGDHLKPMYTYMKVEFEKLMHDPYERSALEYFDFISWFESKITGDSFANIVQRKASPLYRS